MLVTNGKERVFLKTIRERNGKTVLVFAFAIYFHNYVWSRLTAQLVAAFACVAVYHGAYDEYHRCVDCRLAATERRRRRRR